MDGRVMNKFSVHILVRTVIMEEHVVEVPAETPESAVLNAQSMQYNAKTFKKEVSRAKNGPPYQVKTCMRVVN